MTKRRLSQQQHRRIRARQSNLRLKAKGIIVEPGVDPGREREGIIISHYGSQADVVEDPASATASQRCFFRANLENLAVGDRVVWCEGNATGVIVSRLPRDTELCRLDKNHNPRPLAANVERMLLVVAPEPAPQPELIDRYLVAAELQQIEPILVLNKTDLMRGANRPDVEELLSVYKTLNYPMLGVSAKYDRGIDTLCARISDYTCILVGQSGVGKTSLVNRFLPDAGAAVGNLSRAGGQGTHTTTAARLYFLPGGGRLIDSPGIREFGFWHLDVARLAEGFVEFRPHLGNCLYRNCRHERESGCALIKATTEGKINPRRLESFHKIVTSLERC